MKFQSLYNFEIFWETKCTNSKLAYPKPVISSYEFPRDELPLLLDKSTFFCVADILGRRKCCGCCLAPQAMRRFCFRLLSGWEDQKVSWILIVINQNIHGTVLHTRHQIKNYLIKFGNSNLLNYCWMACVSFRVGIGSYGLMDQHIPWGPWGIGHLSWPHSTYIGTSVRIQHIHWENHHSKLVHSGIHFFIDFPSLICLFMYNDVWIY